MKILVFGDAHGDTDAVRRVLEWQSDAEYKLSVGDLEIEEDILLENDVIHVVGNSRHDTGFAKENSLDIGGKKLFMTHGHLYKVHRNLKQLLKHCQAEGCDIVLYGHSHIASYDEIFGIVFINPGSLSRPRNTLPPTYCILTLEEDNLTHTFYDAITNEIIEF